MKLTPNFWVKIHNTRFPEAEGVDVLLHSNRPLAHGDWTDGRLTQIGKIRHALSGVDGAWVRGRFSFAMSDTDRLYRIKHASATEQHFYNKEVEVFVQSETGRWAGQVPYKAMTGIIADANLGDRMSATLTGEDWLGSRRSPFSLERKILENRPITRDIFGPGLDKNSTGRYQQMVVGELSDYGEKDVLGNDAAKGKVVCIPLGVVTIISGDNPSVPPPSAPSTPTAQYLGPPINLTATVVGNQSGTVRKEFGVTLYTRNGQSLMSSTVVVNNGLSTQDRDNYIELNWEPPAAATADTDVLDQIIAYKVWRVDQGGYLDVQNNDGTFVDPELQYRDGEIHNRDENDVVKREDAPTVNEAMYDAPVPGTPPGETATVADWVAFLICGHAVNPDTLHQCYGPDWDAEGGVFRGPMDEGLFGAELLAPGRAGWPHAEPYVDFTDAVTGRVHRTTIMYARGERARMAVENRAGFAWNMCGVEDVGDGSGEPIRRAARVWQHILSEWVIANRGEGYYSGLWAGLPFFTSDPTLCMIDTDSGEAWQEDTVLRIGDRGYKFDHVFTEPVSIGEFITQFNNDFSTTSGPNFFGQAMLTSRDMNMETTTANPYRQHIEIKRMLPASFGWGEIENVIQYQYNLDYDTKKFKSTTETIFNDQSIAAYGGPFAGKFPSSLLSMKYVADLATARDSMAHRLAMRSWRPVYQKYATDLIHFRDDVGKPILLTHFHEGLGVLGYVDVPFKVLDMELDPRSGEWEVLSWSLQRFLEWSAAALEDEEGATPISIILGDESSGEPPPLGAYRLVTEPE